MKIVSLKSKLAVAGPLALVGIFGVSHFALAQPDAVATGKGKKAGKGKKGGLPAKMQEKIETAMGKPLTEDQKTQLAAAAKDQREAMKAAQEKFDAEVVRVTGLTLDQVHDLKKRPKAPAAAN